MRVSGTSAGLGRRSFLAKLRRIYPDAVIDVLYLSHFTSNDDLESLPVDSIIRKIVDITPPFHVKWLNRLSSRFFGVLYAEYYIHQKYAKHLKHIDYKTYDHIFIWSSGLNHETILGARNLPILKKSIVVFHDPYPYPWYKGVSTKIHRNDFLRLKMMIEVVQQAKVCCATAYYMAKDLQYLYASDKYFYSLPHQFALEAFDVSKDSEVRKKEAKLQISYHGALMFGRNLFNVLEAYEKLLKENPSLMVDTEFVLRTKGDNIEKIKEKYSELDNIKVLEFLDFSNSFNEQSSQSDINIVLENGPHYANTLGGKVPFLTTTGKPIFIVSPERSELKRIMKNKKYIADMNNVEDIKLKLGELIKERLTTNEYIDQFGDYFNDENFKMLLNKVLQE
ncbi:hypothetical protein [Gaetbulibacter sp. PBL-D1]|uniref:hypothetical protein n=1 Tax=Gaetbulibacter sp. PBL-D1 TaxID=3422594 RepID=UPI003D2ED70B